MALLSILSDFRHESWIICLSLVQIRIMHVIILIISELVLMLFLDGRHSDLTYWDLSIRLGMMRAFGD